MTASTYLRDIHVVSTYFTSFLRAIDIPRNLLERYAHAAGPVHEMVEGMRAVKEGGVRGLARLRVEASGAQSPEFTLLVLPVGP